MGFPLSKENARELEEYKENNAGYIRWRERVIELKRSNALSEALRQSNEKLRGSGLEDLMEEIKALENEIKNSQLLKESDSQKTTIDISPVCTLKKVTDHETRENSNGKIEFYVTKPFNKEKATVGNGSQISFQTSSRELVDKFHDVGIKLGGASEGSGGERPEGSGVYYSYIRDLDGNKICAFTNNQ